MSDGSTIEWTDATWNPVRGCTKISPGCKHCYAETFAERFRGVPGHPYEQGFDLRFVPEKLPQPLEWRTSRMIFVNSMSDLFHEDVPEDYIEAVARVMQRANWHTYQVLTKRSERMRDLLRTRLRFAAGEPHIWWGVGGESGPGARAMEPAWVLAVRDHCRAAGVPFFFKQWGGPRKSRTGRELDG